MEISLPISDLINADFNPHLVVGTTGNKCKSHFIDPHNLLSKTSHCSSQICNINITSDYLTAFRAGY
ncbi:CLUMA_CG019751, isoform A [Clunio marinus]|uniref:CLUMA_CG019751, isoform A n=1 Tax=Clunio marinus TaxID=568069 RepID=A0A1J1J201_9DIPT|nr:CLUMA_CG019751, isoform A [Clunio marinus]